MATTIWRGHLSFGLVSFPVRLYRAARAEKISFRRLYRPEKPAAGPARVPGAPAAPELFEAPRRRPAGKREPEAAPEPAPAPVYRTHNAVIADQEDEPVERGNIVRGYEYNKDEYVVIEDEEIRNITPETSKEMQIVEFVRMDEIDPVFLETSYYVTPDEAGRRPYSLLFEAMREVGFVGLAQLAMHRREHIVALRPGKTGIIAHTMFYPNEVRQAEEYRADTKDLNKKELDLAKRLIETLVTPFEPEKFRDTYRERLEQLIASKQPAPAAAPRKPAQVVDIMAALEKSLKQSRKRAG
jgi:DNA end-binding protein Ku